VLKLQDKHREWSSNVGGWLLASATHPASDNYLNPRSVWELIAFPAAIAWPWFLIAVLVVTALSIWLFVYSGKLVSSSKKRGMVLFAWLLAVPSIFWVLYAIYSAIWYFAQG
jgi:hypothetical protein